MEDYTIYDTQGNVVKFEDLDMNNGCFDKIDYKNKTCVYYEFNKTHVQIIKDKDEIKELKKELADTDYEAIKYAEGCFTEEEYQEVKEHRQELRDRINELEEEIDKLQEEYDASQEDTKEDK